MDATIRLSMDCITNLLLGREYVINTFAFSIKLLSPLVELAEEESVKVKNKIDVTITNTD